MDEDNNKSVSSLESVASLEEGLKQCSVTAANDDNEEKEPEQQEDEGIDDGPAPEWKNSRARDYLYGLIVDRKIPGRDDITPRAVFDNYCKMRPEFKHFQDYKQIKFADKLRYLRNKISEKEDRSKVDADAFAHDRLIFPAHTQDTKGRPIWAGSKAEELLRKDIQDGKNKEMKPRFLYELREEYNENYDLDFFRNKIYQVEKALKREAYVKAKSDKKKKKKKK